MAGPSGLGSAPVVAGHSDGPAAVVSAWLDAFARGDANGMAACYAREARFSDPVFVDLRGPVVGDMWRMLLSSATVQVRTLATGSDGEEAWATWEASYVFGKSGRAVRNVVSSRFHIRAGLIVEQRDRFPFWRWSRQALGFRGLILGWTPLVRNAVRRQARRRLDAWRSSHASAKAALAA